MRKHFRIDDERRAASRERVDDACQPRGRHVVKAFIGPAQRMRRDDDVVHGEQRIAGFDRFPFEHSPTRQG